MQTNNDNINNSNDNNDIDNNIIINTNNTSHTNNVITLILIMLILLIVIIPRAQPQCVAVARLRRSEVLALLCVLFMRGLLVSNKVIKYNYNNKENIKKDSQKKEKRNMCRCTYVV